MHTQEKLSPSSVMDLITNKQEGETGYGITDYTYKEGYKAVKEYGGQMAIDAAEDSVRPSEALMCFLSWATCQPGSLILGASHESSWAVVAFEKFTKEKDWKPCREDYLDRV